VGPFLGEFGAPWSILGHKDSLGMLRPNPLFPESHLASGLVGTSLTWDAEGIRGAGSSVGEVVHASNTIGAVSGTWTFGQVTSDVRIEFPVIRDHQYRLDAHWVTTLGDRALPQRFVYIGGPGTIPFLDLLEQGGDQLLFLDQRYSVPFDSIRVRVLGSPTLYLRHRFGSAGLGRLPAFEQALGVGVAFALVRGELNVNPANGDVRVSAGLTMSR
jgi:hypothetical protein